MADFTANFEAGSNGATITTGAGEASLTAWDAIVATPIYDNTHVHSGSLAAFFDGNPEIVAWQTFPNPTDHYGRMYVYFTANAGGFTRIFYVRQSATMVAELLFNAGSSRLIIEDTGEAHNATSTNGIGLNQWVRIEWHVVHSATVGQIEIKFFNDPESGAPTETLSSPASWDTGTAATGIEVGNVAGGAESWWLDDVVANATSWVGPLVIPSTAPQRLQPRRGGTGRW